MLEKVHRLEADGHLAATLQRAVLVAEKAPEVAALVQPNSVSIGLKKTPKA